MIKIEDRQFILKDKKEVAKDVHSLSFETSNGENYEYRAGQYVNVTTSAAPGRAKSYTISSAPDEGRIVLTVKKRGEFSSALIGLDRGDTIYVEGPLGHFYPNEVGEALVFLAGGVGIAPFISMIRDKNTQERDESISLFYSNKKFEDVAFFDELNAYRDKEVIKDLVYVLTEEKTKHPRIDEYKRIDSALLEKHLGSLSGKRYYICGSPSFVDSMRRNLAGSGVERGDIITETYY